MELSIIIVNWNSTEYLRMCLLSIYSEARAISFEVIVIDNCSRDESCSDLIKSCFPNVMLHRSNTNLGFAKACNYGAQLSSGKLLLFLNPDTEIHNDVFGRMRDGFLLADRVGAVGARLLNTDGSLQMSSIQAYPTILNQILDSEFLRRKWPRSNLWGISALFNSSKYPQRVSAISGACLMISREAFDEVKGFDERYFMYVEDLDICQRLSHKGFALLYLGDCEVTHHGGKSSSVQGRYFANLRQQQAILKYFLLTKGRWYSAAYRFFLAAMAAARVLAIVCTLPFRSIKKKENNQNFSLEKWVRIFKWAVKKDFPATN